MCRAQIWTALAPRAASSGDSSSNVNVDAETTKNGGVGANMSNDKAIDKGTVDSGAPFND